MPKSGENLIQLSGKGISIKKEKMKPAWVSVSVDSRKQEHRKGNWTLCQPVFPRLRGRVGCLEPSEKWSHPSGTSRHVSARGRRSSPGRTEVDGLVEVSSPWEKLPGWRQKGSGSHIWHICCPKSQRWWHLQWGQRRESPRRRGILEEEAEWELGIHQEPCICL